jgi:hypothetical protein
MRMWLRTFDCSLHISDMGHSLEAKNGSRRNIYD